MADNAGGEGGGGGRHCNLLTSRWKNCQVRLRLKRKMRSGGRCWGITRWKFRISSFFFFFIASEIWWDIDIDVDKNLSIRLLILFSQAIDDFLSILFSDQIIRIDQKFIERFLNFNMAILLHFKYNYHFLSSILDQEVNLNFTTCLVFF